MKVVIFVILILVFGGLVSFVCAEELTEVEKSALFDIFIEIPSEYQEVNVGEEILFTLKLVNLGGEGRIDVSIEYEVLNKENEILLGRQETVAIETQASFLRSVNLDGVPPGDYILGVELIYSDGRIAQTSHSFVIRRVAPNKMWFAGFIVLIVVGIIFLYPKIKLLRDKMRIKLRVREIVRKANVS